ncbi:protein lifeguard 1-like [Limulus polyphemus]|uniref:Protein lifeguard 1-like n=1 Tax=Limulus polyphemus TaxID=6850 RepID=A0ABM1C624_LIMPO|nr:protein lifeguard 1-like [Limulus polyphemus]
MQTEKSAPHYDQELQPPQPGFNYSSNYGVQSANYSTPYSPQYSQQSGFVPPQHTSGTEALTHDAPPPYTQPVQVATAATNSTTVDPPVYVAGSVDNDYGEGLVGWNFSEKSIRKAFVRKVYAILMTQLAFTVGIVALFVFEKNVKMFVQKNYYIAIGAYITFPIVYIVLVCCKSVRRKWPVNFIFLIIFTCALSYLVGTISSLYDTQIVLIALGICTSCCLAITIFSFHTKFDFTTCGGVLFILCWVLFMFGILAIFTYNNILKTVYAALGALLFMAFLAYDTQVVIGGKKYEISPEEHIFAALQLYLDVVYIFLFILSILGGGKK